MVDVGHDAAGEVSAIASSTVDKARKRDRLNLAPRPRDAISCGRVVWPTTPDPDDMDLPIPAADQHQASEPVIWTVHGKCHFPKSWNM